MRPGPIRCPTLPLRYGDETHIPTHFSKGLYTPAHGGQAIAFVFENDDDSGPLSSGAVSIRELEELTELDFFLDMPKDRQELIVSAGPNLGLCARSTPAISPAMPITFAGLGNQHCDQQLLQILNGCVQGNKMPQASLPASA